MGIDPSHPTQHKTYHNPTRTMAGIRGEPIRGGTRGGQGLFKWSDVAADKDRENYLGHSVFAPAGRWQNNRDVTWYNKDKKEDEAEAKRAEIRKVKEAEEDALSVALGFAPTRRPVTVDKTEEELEQERLEKEQRKLEKAARKEGRRRAKEERRQEKEAKRAARRESGRDRSRSVEQDRRHRHSRRDPEDDDSELSSDDEPDRRDRRVDSRDKRRSRSRSPHARRLPHDYPTARDREGERRGGHKRHSPSARDSSPPRRTYDDGRDCRRRYDDRDDRRSRRSPSPRRRSHPARD